MEDKEWFLYVVDHHEGPFTIAEIKKKIKDGDAKTSSFVWKDGCTDWTMMSDSIEFGTGSPKSDGHGLFSFITKLTSKKKSAAAVAAQSAAAQPAVAPRVSEGRDVTDVPSSASVWCLNSRKIFTGPHSLKTIVRRINNGEVSVQDSIWKEGWVSFVPLNSIPHIMEQIKPDVLQGKGKSKKTEGGAAASAMGITDTITVRRRHWYNAGPIRTLLVFLALSGTYHALTTGMLDPLLEKAKIKAQVQELHLKPIPFERVMAELPQIKETLAPLLQKVVVMLPEPVRGYLSSIRMPEGLNANDSEMLTDLALSNLDQGARVASALPVGEVMNPRFVLASNMPDGTSFTIVLRGSEGTLLNAFTYEKTMSVDLMKHVVKTPVFGFEGTKPLPKGEYLLLIYEADKQTPEVTALLEKLPKKKAPKQVPEGKRVFVVDSFFLGGKKDAAYATRLKEYNERIKTQLAQEAAELKQMSLTIENIANESAVKFTNLMKVAANAQRKNNWVQYDKEYQKISKQILTTYSASTAAGTEPKVLSPIYRKLQKTHQLSDQLHQAESDVLDAKVKPDVVDALASQVADSIGDLKQDVFKVIK